MKKLFGILASLIGAATINAQPTITSAVLPIKGDTILMALDSTLVPAGASGANVTWDFSANLQQDLPIQRIYLDPTATAYSAKFPNAKLCRTDGIGKVFSYWDNSNTSKSVYYGFVEPGIYDQHYNNLPVSYYKFPISYGQSYADSLSAVTNPGAVVGPGKYYFAADGWGTLKLPAKTYSNVLRTKSVVYIGDSSPAINSYSLTTEYAWYEPSHKEPLLVISSVIINHSLYRKFIIYENLLTSGLNMLTNHLKLKVFPNPANDRLYIETENTLKGHQLEITDITGKSIILSLDESVIDVSSLGRGIYFLKIISGEKQITQKFIKE